MSIQTLPPSTIRIIGSSQVLTDPTSVVKELVDNALDAKATSIFVEISANALDVIQVRDNGHGIAPEDRDMVCRRYCTSKLRDYSELKDVGGRWLGFRGEALSSAAELSGTLALTTRIEGEDVAVCLKIKTNGEVEGRDRASHPIGTTVRLTGLFDTIPVRKQTAVKQSAKTLVKTKRLLQSYALARPSIRFSLRVLKAKNDKGNWTYAPKSGSGVEDAAFKVVGKECASQCEWSVLEKHGFEVQAFLPRVDAEGSKISGLGHFVSIDSRPVTTARGTMKQMMTLFKEKLRAANPDFANTREIFIWMNIVCPPQSYDPNIEPAKDDVMFEDKDKVLEAVTALFDQCYPARTVKEPENTTCGSVEIYEDVASNEADNPPKRQGHGHSNMYSGNDEVEEEIFSNLDVSALINPDAEEEEAESSSGLRDPKVSNPWITARMNASIRPKRTGSWRNGQLLTPLQERNISDINSTSRTEAITFPPHTPWAPPSPHFSSPVRHAISTNDVASTGNKATRLTYDHSVQDEGPDPIQDNAEENQGPSIHQPRRRQWTGWTAINDFVPAAQLPLSTPSSPPPQTQSQPFRPVHRHQYLRAAAAAAASINKPFVFPVHDESRMWFDSASPTKRNAGEKRKRRDPQHVDIRDAFASAAGILEPVRRRPRRDATLEVDGDVYEDDDMEVGLDAAGLQEHHHAQDSPRANSRIRAFVHPDEHMSLDELPQSFTSNIQPPADLPNPTDQSNTTSSLQTHLPHTHHPPTKKPTRNPSRHLSRTANLPLERIPPDSQLQTLLLKVSTCIPSLSNLISELQLLERECEDLLAPVWGVSGAAAGDEALSDGGGGTEGGDGDGGVLDGEGEVGGLCSGVSRSSLVLPRPTEQEVGMWERRVRMCVRERGLFVAAVEAEG